MMTEEQRAALLASLKDVHDRVHSLYPRGVDAAEPAGHALRNQLLVVDLVVHLAEEVVRTSAPDEQKVAERMANLLYALRLVAPHSQLDHAAELLIDAAHLKAS
jgi:hypothetical protein